MTALKTVYPDDTLNAFYLGPFYRDASGKSLSSGAACKKYSFVLRVDINKFSSFDAAKIDKCGPIHSDFLVYGHYHLKLRMRYRSIIHNSHAVGNCNAVVSAESSSLGIHVYTVALKSDRILQKIYPAVLRLLTYHIHVSLQYQRLFILISFGSFNSYYEIIKLILNYLMSSFNSKILYKIAYLLRIARTVRYGAYLFKHTEDFSVVIKIHHYIHNKKFLSKPACLFISKALSDFNSRHPHYNIFRLLFAYRHGVFPVKNSYVPYSLFDHETQFSISYLFIGIKLFYKFPTVYIVGDPHRKTGSHQQRPDSFYLFFIHIAHIT